MEQTDKNIVLLAPAVLPDGNGGFSRTEADNQALREIAERMDRMKKNKIST